MKCLLRFLAGNKHSKKKKTIYTYLRFLPYSQIDIFVVSYSSASSHLIQLWTGKSDDQG